MIKGFQAPQRPKHHKNSSRYDCCAIFQIFWSPTIDLCVKQHQASYSCQEPCCLVNMWQMKTNIYVQEMTDVVISVVFWVAKTLVGRRYKTQIIHYNMCSKISSKYQMFDILQLHGFLVWSLKKICGHTISFEICQLWLPKICRLDLSATEVVLFRLQIWAKVI